MSEEIEPFDEQSDDSEMICPYCKEAYQPEGEDYDDSGHIAECDDCGKKYHARQDFSVTHIATPDCELNGEEHQYSMHSLGGGREHPFCDKCSKCKPH